MKRVKRVEAWATVVNGITIPTAYRSGPLHLVELRPGERIVGPEEASVVRAAKAYAKKPASATNDALFDAVWALSKAKGKAKR